MSIRRTRVCVCMCMSVTLPDSRATIKKLTLRWRMPKSICHHRTGSRPNIRKYMQLSNLEHKFNFESNSFDSGFARVTGTRKKNKLIDAL